MTEFQKKLRNTFQLDGTPIYGNYSFCKWMIKKDGTVHFQFHLLNQKKSIPLVWLLEAKQAKESGVIIDRHWVYDNYGVNDCRASVTKWLLYNT